MNDALVATVLLPTTGDRGALLELSVPTVLNQTVQDLELIILGDGVSDAARATIHKLQAEDPRIHFLDQPKDARRGERRRHDALQKARGRIVLYLCDRDLFLPHHVETLDTLLRTADFAHTLRFGITEAGGFSFAHALDITHAEDRAAAAHTERLIPLSFVGHTLEMYRRLPYGWRATPPDVPTDHYMWEQILAQPDTRTAVSQEPTVLYFKRGDHPGWPAAQRAEELVPWSQRLRDPAWFPAFRETVRDAAIADRARLDRELRASRPDGLRRWLWWRFPRLLGWIKTHRTPHAFLGWASRRLTPPSLGEARAKQRIGRPNAVRAGLPHIHHTETAWITDEISLEVQWVDPPLGPGPRAAVFAFDDELMRLDCFGGDRGHMHFNLKQARLAPQGGAAQIAFPPGSVHEHVARGMFELRHNLRYALTVNRDPRIRALTLDPARLEQSVAWMGERMHALVDKLGDQPTHPTPQATQPSVGGPHHTL